MPRTKKPYSVVKAANVSIPIYETAKGFMAKWTYGGVPGRKERVDFSELEDEVKLIAARISRGEPIDEEFALQNQLRYYRELEERLNGVPLHIAVDSYLANHHIAETWFGIRPMR